MFSIWLYCIILVLGTVCATYRPIIGILSQEKYPLNTTHKSLIGASYVKAVEGAGARVVPIAINQSEEYYQNVLSQVNGVLFPGGGVIFTDPEGYGEAGKHIYKIAKKMNDEGDYFPILGVCLGYELLMFLAAGSYDILADCKSHAPTTLHFVSGYRHSKLYKYADWEILEILRDLPVAINSHKKCVTIENLKNNSLGNQWRVMSTSKDENGLEFISSSESKKYPFAGIQFHPEKNAYEWKPSQKNPHTRKAISSNRYFYDWLVNQARLNHHSFASVQDENDALIYNYLPEYLGKNNGSYEQVYYFNV